MNINNSHLTIFIPTFNRWNILSKTLPHTLGCLPEDFVVRIINNNSKEDGRGKVEKVITEHKNIDCKIIDNPVNIGGDANFLRCVELCKTPYIMVLGDDDYLEDNFIKEVDFYLIQKNHWGWINFQMKRNYANRYPKDRVFNNPFQMISSCNNWAELMFISSTIFSAKLLKNGLREAHLWQSTFSVLPIAALKGWENQEQSNPKVQYSFALSAREIVNCTGHGDAHYNQVDIYQHLPIMESVPFNTLAREKIIKRAVRGGTKYIFKPRVLIKHFYSCIWSQPFSKSFMEYKAICRGLEYMIGPKTFFYQSYLTIIIIATWVARVTIKSISYHRRKT